MGNKEPKGEHEGGEAVKRVQQKQPAGAGKKPAVDPEDEPVTAETRKAAENELRAALQRLREGKDKK